MKEVNRNGVVVWKNDSGLKHRNESPAQISPRGATIHKYGSIPLSRSSARIQVPRRTPGDIGVLSRMKTIKKNGHIVWTMVWAIGDRPFIPYIRHDEAPALLFPDGVAVCARLGTVGTETHPRPRPPHRLTHDSH
jgi:hypothetical protein